MTTPCRAAERYPTITVADLIRAGREIQESDKLWRAFLRDLREPFSAFDFHKADLDRGKRERAIVAALGSIAWQDWLPILRLAEADLYDQECDVCGMQEVMEAIAKGPPSDD